MFPKSENQNVAPNELVFMQNRFSLFMKNDPTLRKFRDKLNNRGLLPMRTHFLQTKVLVPRPVLIPRGATPTHRMRAWSSIMSTETITPTPTNDHTHRGQDKSENGPQLALESVSRGVWHCVAQHFQNAARCSAKLPGRPFPKPVGAHF